MSEPGPTGGPVDAEWDLLALPELPPPDDPRDLVLANPVPPGSGRPCGDCGRTVGGRIPDLPVRHEGYCPHCGTGYSLLPQLRAGERLDGGRYEVLGCLARGGLGWVYLAVDTRLRDRPVALKGVLNPKDSEARERILEERDRLIAIDHSSIVRILDYVPHRPDSRDADREGDGGTGSDAGGSGARVPAEYIVMDFVGGKSLRQILREERDGRQPLGGPFRLEYVARYGCQILRALTELHRRGLVYCDMKPDNVIHRGTRTVLIDLGGVQQSGDPRKPVITREYCSPEVGTGGAPPTVAHDVYTVGSTLRELVNAAGDRHGGNGGLGDRSLDYLIKRATAEHPCDRFASAEEMALQLEGVLQELLPPPDRHPGIRPSVVFAHPGTLIDSGLGAVPAPEHWDDRVPADYRGFRISSRLLPHDCPGSARTAVGLPSPVPDPGDPAIDRLRLPAPQERRTAVRQLHRFLDGEDRRHRSVEVRLRLCRLHLRLGAALPQQDPERALELSRARQSLHEAEDVLDGLPDRTAGSDWRIAWHRGLLALAGADPGTAEEDFERVYRAVPGEYAPRLALGHCAEHRADRIAARRHYEAVWQRNTRHGSAAFALARVRLTEGDRTGAAEVLSSIPSLSRHYDAARVAALRIRAARLSSDPAGLPAWRDLEQAGEGLSRLALDNGERIRLVTELREWALDWIQTIRQDGTRQADREQVARLGGELFGGPGPPTERRLRTLLSGSFRELARLSGITRRRNEHLVDLANAVHPRTWFV